MSAMPPKTKAKAKGRVKAVRMLASGPCGNCPTMYLNPHERHPDPGSRPVLVLDASPEAEAERVEAIRKAISKSAVTPIHYRFNNKSESWAEYRARIRALEDAQASVV